MSVRHIDYLKIKPSRILVVEIRPVRCIIETPSGPSRTAKWMTYTHWKELRFMLNEIADQYEEQRTSQKTTEEVECNKGKTKEGSTIKIGYMFTTYRKCSCVYMTPRDTWSDDDDDDDDGELRDKGGRYQQFLPCGEMLVVSVALQDTLSPSQGKDIQKAQVEVKASRSELEKSFMSPARSDRQLLKALDSSIVFTNTISDYFGSSQKKSLSESSMDSQASKEIISKDKQSKLKNMVSKSKVKHKRKHGDSSSSTLQSENELPNKRQVTKKICKFNNNVVGDLSEDILEEYSSDIKDIIRNEDLPHAEDYSENSPAVDKESESYLESHHRSSVQDSTDTVKSAKDNFSENDNNQSSLKKNIRDPRNDNSYVFQDKKTLCESLSPVLQRRVNSNALSLPQVIKGYDAVNMNRDIATEDIKGILSSTPDTFPRNEVDLQQEGREKTKRKQMKLHTLFGDCAMPWKKKDDCHEMKERNKSMLRTDQEYIPLPLKDKKTLQEIESGTKDFKSASRKEKSLENSELSDNDDHSQCRRSSRIKQNKEKCAVKERKSYIGDDYSDLSVCQSKESEGSQSPLSKENLDSSVLSVNDILLSGRNVKKISSSAETLKAIAQLEKIRKDIEKLDQYDDSLLENDHLDLSQTSDKDFIMSFKNSNNNKKKHKNLPSDQRILDSWISPKVTTNKKESDKNSKMKIDKNSKMKIDKSTNKVTAKNKEKKTSVHEKESEKVALKKKNKKVKKKVSNKTEKMKDTQKDIFAACKSVSSKDKKLTQTTLKNIRKHTEESISSDSSCLSTQIGSVNLQGVSLEKCLEHASDSCEENDSLPDLDLSGDKDYHFESNNDQENCIPQNDSRSSDQLLYSQNASSEELNLKYEGSSPIKSHCEPQVDLDAKDLAESDDTSNSVPAPWLKLRNRLIAMSLEELDEHMKTILPYLKKIARGQEPSRRHEIFKEGGKDFRYLADDLLFGPFTEDHILHAVDYLNQEFSKSVEKACGKDRVNEYIWKVLVPSLFIRIVVENENMTNAEAEKILVEVSMNKKIDY